jgi:hypothetical protein
MTTSSLAPATPPACVPGEARLRVTALLVATMWLDVLHDAAGSGHPFAPWLVALCGLAAQLAFTAAETAAAAMAWRLLGRSVGWLALGSRVLVASAAETLAVSIAAGRARLPHVWAVALVGERALGASPAHGVAAAFAATGLLTLVRIVLSAGLQARAARASFATAIGVVLALWLVSRLAVWWTFDLLQGRSFQP